MSDELKRLLLMRVLEAMQEADNYYVSADQAQAAIALIRAETLEEAATIVDGMADEMERDMKPSKAVAWVKSKAAAIRALKDKS